MKERVRILRFTIIGTLNALIAAFVVWLMMHIRKEDYMLANVTAYVVSQIHNFIWCKYWIFPLDKENKKNTVWHQMLLHCNEYLAQFLGLFIYGAVNFSCNKFLTFR